MKIKYFIICLTGFLLTGFLIMFSSYLIGADMDKTSLAVISQRKDYHSFNADGDDYKDILLLSFEDDSPKLVFSTKTSAWDISSQLSKVPKIPFYLFAKDVTGNGACELIVYDINAAKKNTLYIYSLMDESVECIFSSNCDYFGFMDFGGDLRVSLVSDDSSYALSFESTKSYSKVPMPALSTATGRTSYENMLTGSSKALSAMDMLNQLVPGEKKFIGEFFNLKLDKTTFSSSSNKWCAVFESEDGSLKQCVINLDEHSVSLIR